MPEGQARNPPPVDTEAREYQKYLARGGDKHPSKFYGGKNKRPRTDEQKKWDQWEKDRHSDKLSDYQTYKNTTDASKGQSKLDSQVDYNWRTFESEQFGSRPDRAGGTGEGGAYTLQDLYIKTSNKQWQDRQRDLKIDPDKKDKKGGGSAKGGSRKTGGKTSGPGNPNTGAAAAGDANF